MHSLKYTLYVHCALYNEERNCIHKLTPILHHIYESKANNEHSCIDSDIFCNESFKNEYYQSKFSWSHLYIGIHEKKTLNTLLPTYLKK